MARDKRYIMYREKKKKKKLQGAYLLSEKKKKALTKGQWSNSFKLLKRKEKSNSQVRILYLVKMSIKNEGKMTFLSDKC